MIFLKHLLSHFQLCNRESQGVSRCKPTQPVKYDLRELQYEVGGAVVCQGLQEGVVDLQGQVGRQSISQASDKGVRTEASNKGVRTEVLRYSWECFRQTSKA